MNREEAQQTSSHPLPEGNPLLSGQGDPSDQRKPDSDSRQEVPAEKRASDSGKSRGDPAQPSVLRALVASENVDTRRKSKPAILIPQFLTV
jgi:hypothetical protein